MVTFLIMPRSINIGALLGSLQLLEDGKPADPAMWHDWLQCIEKILPRQILR